MATDGYRTHLNRERWKLAARRGSEVSYQDVATATQLNYMTVHRYATKAISRPDYDTLAKLAEFFGVAVEDFVYKVEGKEEAPKGQIAAAPAV
ncbi:MAG TPA: helix-turn-helix transcriptional regulator [Bellilinea sp.]|nr:helix-turn-helix transcriptional regulator [Bellilinea sp.]